MIGPPGSTLWLLSAELRLAWRNALGRRGGRVRFVVLGLFGLVALVPGVTLGFVLRRVSIPINPYTVLVADAATLVVFTLMLSQTLAGAIEALYTRGDLDLLFSSPLDPRKTLTVRFLALAANAFLAFGTFTLPFLLPIAIIGHLPWLGFIPTLAAVALGASATGLAMAVGLFRLIGPRRTRVVAQILAAVIGAAFFLSTQIRNLFGGRQSSSFWLQVAQAAGDPSLHLPPIASWPLRAATGEALPLLGLIALGGLGFFGVSAWLGRRFAADAASAQGVDVGVAARARRGPVAAFANGPFAATFGKEVRLLRRDIALLAQVLLRVLYLLPATFLLLRNAAHGATLAGGAAFLCVMSGQVAASLTWITVSAEDAPELLISAPASPTVVRRAKLAAGLAPLVVLLVPLLIVLIALAPLAGLTATLGAAASAAAAAMINAWRPAPGKRTEFRRRRSGSILTAYAQFFVSLLIAAATALVALGSMISLLAIIPALLAAVALLLLRRSDAQIAEAFAANA